MSFSSLRQGFQRFLLMLIFFLTLGVALRWVLPASSVQALTAAPRGVSHDLWADVVTGKRDFGEMGQGVTIATRYVAPGGVGIDRGVGPGKAFIWDSGNNRILGYDLGNCYGASKPCAPDLVFGQPSPYDYGACNQDASFQYFPDRATSSASTLCGVSENSHTSLEDKSSTAMVVDGDHNLFVVDSLNNRILKFDDPFATDTVADEVWGQSDFTGNQCNRTGSLATGDLGSPTADSLCFLQGFTPNLGIALDPDGNLWVSDGSNNRILRFPKDTNTGVIAKTADIVLGQPDFTTQDLGGGDTLDRVKGPGSLTFDGSGNLLVVDGGNGGRILKYEAPFSTHMSASGTFGDTLNLSGTSQVKLVPGTDHILIKDQGSNSNQRFRIVDSTGTTELTAPMEVNPGFGPMDFDADGNILFTSNRYQVDALRLFNNGDGTYTQDLGLLGYPAEGQELTAGRLSVSGWPGLAVIDNQLIVNDGRMLFWNNANTLTSATDADGYIYSTSSAVIPTPGFGVVSPVPASHLIWVSRGDFLNAYNTPLTQGAEPIATISSTLNTIDNKTFPFGTVYGLAASSDNNFLWVSDQERNRVFRVRNPLTTPKVDIVLGQGNLTSTNCNRGVVAAANANPVPSLSMLCSPSHLSLDSAGNLYVSESFIEIQGNQRLLLFSADTFPNNNTAVLYGPSAIKSFPLYTPAFQTAFDSANHMVTGYNPYLGGRFMRYFIDPLLVSGTDNQNAELASASGQLNDFYSWATNAFFDSNDNLWTYDANRGQVRKYIQPFTQLPTAFISNPVPSSAGSVINFSAEATTSAALDHIELLVDGVAIATSSSSPISTSFDASVFIHNSYHAFTARVTDSNGAVGETSKLIKGIDVTPPTSTITSPTNGASLSRNTNITFTADATDNAAVQSVEFRINNTLKCTDATAPYTCSWKTPNIPGSYTLKAKAIDKAGNNTTDTITVTVL